MREYKTASLNQRGGGVEILTDYQKAGQFCLAFVLLHK